MPPEHVIVGGATTCGGRTLLCSHLPHFSAAPPPGVPVIKFFLVYSCVGIPYRRDNDTPRFRSLENPSWACPQCGWKHELDDSHALECVKCRRNGGRMARMLLYASNYSCIPRPSALPTGTSAVTRQTGGDSPRKRQSRLEAEPGTDCHDLLVAEEVGRCIDRNHSSQVETDALNREMEELTAGFPPRDLEKAKTKASRKRKSRDTQAKKSAGSPSVHVRQPDDVPLDKVPRTCL